MVIRYVVAIYRKSDAEFDSLYEFDRAYDEDFNDYPLVVTDDRDYAESTAIGMNGMEFGAKYNYVVKQIEL